MISVIHNTADDKSEFDPQTFCPVSMNCREFIRRLQNEQPAAFRNRVGTVADVTSFERNDKLGVQ